MIATVTPLALLALLALAHGFNLDPRHAVVMDDPQGDRGSYFGYALGFWRQSTREGNSTWLLVGAPQAQEEGLKGERVRQPGAVYKCSVDDVDDTRCYRMAILGEEDRREQDLRWRWKTMNIPKRAWIGATITVENKPNGAVVVCAPRMKQMMNRDTWYIPGMCFYWKTDDEILPLTALEKAYRPEINRKNGFYIGLAQSGIAAHFVENSTTSQVVVGAPGVDYFTGAMNIYEQHDPFSNKLPSLHVRKLAADLHSYLGYSVTSARLYTDGRISYIAGAPRDKGFDFFTGAVYVASGVHQTKWAVETKLEGQQMGEYFGACVASVDLNLDGVDDLVLVGAPLHSLRQSSTVDMGEHGLLYVYKNMGQGTLEPAPTVLTGSAVAGARFASAITTIGDVNRDGYNDIAVGAPYEGGGAVYIYLGSRHGLSSSHTQRIAASDISTGLAGFGYSLAAGIDLDGNSFNDLAIGSYDSGNVVVVRSYPVIEMDASLQPAVNNLDVNANSVTVKACLGFTTNADTKLLPFIDAVTTIKGDSTWKRTVLESGGHVQELHLRLKRDEIHCWDIQASLKGNLLQKMHPVEFAMDYRVSDDPHIKRDEKFCKMCPVTDPLKPSSVHIKIPFANGCGGRAVCLADLKVDLQSSNEGKAIVLGESPKITLAVSVVNSKEPAYLTKMSLILPKSTSLAKMPKHCYIEEEGSLDDPDENEILCGLGNVLEADQKRKTIKERTTVFEIDVSSVGVDTSLLTFNITTWSASEEQMPVDNTVIVKVPVKLVSEVGIAGNTLQKHLIFSSNDEKLPSVISVIHKYEVTNLGPSPVGHSSIVASLPFGLMVDENIGVIIFAETIIPQVTVKGHTQRCTVDYSSLNIASRRKRDVSALEFNGTESELIASKNVFHLNCSEPGVKRAACALVTCDVGLLAGGETAEVKLQFNINRTMIDLIQQKDVIQISSTGWTEVPEKYHTPSGKRMKLTHVTTLLVGNFEESISPWILILSTVIGLFLFSFMVTILSKVGFFRRKYKENMETMRHAEQEFDYQKFLPEFENNIFF